MSTNNIAFVLLGAAAVLYLSRNKGTNGPTQQFVPQSSYVPPQPPQTNSQAWLQWVQAIVGTYGTVATLWQPGGPFYQQNISPEEAQNIAFNFSQGINHFP